MTSPQQPPTGARFWTIIAALAPPALVGAGFSTAVAEHPFLSVLILTAYFAVLFVTKVLKRVVEPAIEEWISRSTHAFYGLAWRYRAKYLERLEVSLKFVELLGAKTSTAFAVRLPDVYVDLSLKRRAAADSHTGGIATDTRISLDELIDAQDGGVFVITGGPGSGKTTLLRFKALQLAGRRTRGSRLPIVLELRHHVKTIVGDPNRTVATLTASLDWLHGSHGADWFERQLQRGRCLVMLDGLDEVAAETDRRKVVNWVRAQTDRYRRNPFVVTSRPHGYRADRLSNADELEVRRFTSEQIHRFVHNWYRVTWMRRTNEAGEGIAAHAEREAADLIGRLRGTSALFKLAENPMLLTMMTNVHITSKVLPGSRASLYGEICEMLLHKRQEAKAIGGIGDLLTVEQKLQVCRTLASHMMRVRVRDLAADDALRVVRDVLAGATTRVTPEDFLAETENSGLLVQPVEGEYAFAHLTFQEYLAAMALREGDGSAALAATVDDAWWFEATLLWSAGANATAVVEACLRSGSAQALRLALACADEARDIAPATRAQLDRLRRSVDGEEERVRRHLLIAAQVGHTLRDLVWLGEETVFCARPVSAELYGLYLRDLDLHARRDGNGGGPVDGLWDRDVTGFIAWANRLPGIDGSYRLPTPREVRDSPVEDLQDVRGRGVWVRGEKGLAIHGGPQVPFDPAAAGDRVRDEAAGYLKTLRDMLKPAQAAVLLRTYDLAAEQARAIERGFADPQFDHYTAVTKLLRHLGFANKVAPSSGMAAMITRLREARERLERAQKAHRELQSRASANTRALQARHAREKDPVRREELARQLRDERRADSEIARRKDENVAAVAGEMDEAMAESERETTVLLRRLAGSRDRLARWATTAGDELGLLGHTPALFDAAVASAARLLYRRVKGAPGGIGPLIRVSLFGVWSGHYAKAVRDGRKNKEPGWAGPAELAEALFAAATDPGTPGTTRWQHEQVVAYGRIEGTVETVLRSVREYTAEQTGDDEAWYGAVVAIVEHVRTTLRPVLAAEMTADPGAMATARLALALVSLTPPGAGVSHLIRDVNRGLASAEQFLVGEQPAGQVLLLVRA